MPAAPVTRHCSITGGTSRSHPTKPIALSAWGTVMPFALVVVAGATTHTAIASGGAEPSTSRLVSAGHELTRRMPIVGGVLAFVHGVPTTRVPAGEHRYARMRAQAGEPNGTSKQTKTGYGLPGCTPRSAYALPNPGLPAVGPCAITCTR